MTTPTNNPLTSLVRREQSANVDQILKLLTDSLAEQITRKVCERIGEARPALKPKLLSTTAAAAYLSCSSMHVRNLIERGVLPVVKWPAEFEGQRQRQWIDIDDLDRVIEQNKHHAA